MNGEAMSDIYEQHEAAFRQVSAYVVLKDGERVATIAIRFPKDGAGRLYAYVHWLGAEMVRGFAVGGGYDKKSAAIAHAASRITDPLRTPEFDTLGCDAFRAAISKDDGTYWDRRLRDAGFTVLQAI